MKTILLRRNGLVNQNCQFMLESDNRGTLKIPWRGNAKFNGADGESFIFCRDPESVRMSDAHGRLCGVGRVLQKDPPQARIVFGLDVVELVKPWRSTLPLIWIAPWPNKDPSIPAEAELIGRIGPILDALNCEWHTAMNWGHAQAEIFRQGLARANLRVSPTDRMFPQSVLRAMRQASPRDAILTTDVGSHKILAALDWFAYVPNSFMVSNGLSCMGFGLPAAIAAGLVFPKRTVLCATGDAGLAMNMGELALLRELELPVIVVVLNDGALDLIRSQQRRAGKPVFGTEFANPDFSIIAGAFGLASYRVSSEAQCKEAIMDAIRNGRPVLVEALIDPASYPTSLPAG